MINKNVNTNKEILFNLISSVCPHKKLITKIPQDSFQFLNYSNIQLKYLLKLQLRFTLLYR